MAIELHGFMQDEKWGEDIGHIVFGYLPIDLLWWLREWTTVRLPGIFKGQWPPGKPVYTGRPTFPGSTFSAEPFVSYPHQNVSDSARDELGRSIGAQIRVLTLGALLWWKW